jgi:hypothetical protein
MELTRMFRGPNSVASVVVAAFTAAFVAFPMLLAS